MDERQPQFIPVSLRDAVSFKIMTDRAGVDDSILAYMSLIALLAPQVGEPPKLPARMPYREAMNRFVRENAGFGFPVIRTMQAQNNGEVETAIKWDYLNKLVERFMEIETKLKEKGIMTFEEAGSGRGLMLMQGGGFQLVGKSGFTPQRRF